MRVYLDSCIVIYLHEGELALRGRVSAWLRPSQGSPPRPCVSELVRLECRVGPMRRGESDLPSSYDAFFTLPGLEPLPMTREVYEHATVLRAGFGLRTPDALHVATARVGGCEELWTGDERLARHDLGLRVRVLGL